MTFSVLLTVAAGLAMAAAQLSVDMAHISDDIETSKHTCAEELGIDWSQWDESFNNYGVAEELKHFYSCFLQRMKVMTPDGKITLPEGLPKREEAQACVDAITETDMTERALQSRTCVNKIVG